MAAIYKNCDKCHGLGQYQDAFASCPHCTLGQILVGGQAETCPYCHGFGKVSPPPFVTCSVCDGSGKVRDKRAEKEAAKNPGGNGGRDRDGAGEGSNSGTGKTSPKRFMGYALTFKSRILMGFITLGVGVLFRKETPSAPDIFSVFSEEHAGNLYLIACCAFGFLFPRAVLVPIIIGILAIVAYLLFGAYLSMR